MTDYPLLFIILFLHQTTTMTIVRFFLSLLFIILFLHQTTTCLYTQSIALSCLSSCSYIKPQHPLHVVVMMPVVYHLVPTSNHNLGVQLLQSWMLFIILFLHQTTTISLFSRNVAALFIILFLHQTTTLGCLSSHSVQLFIILFLHQTTTQNMVVMIQLQLFIILFLHQTTTFLRSSI